MSDPPRHLGLAIVSASPLARAGLRRDLARSGPFEVLLACATLAQARSQGYAQADALLVEGHADSVDALQIGGPPAVWLLEAPPPAIADWLADGVGLLAADASIDAIVAALQAVVAGLAVLPPAWLAPGWSVPVAEPAGGSAAAGRRPGSEPAVEALTPREREVLARLSEGLGNREIAQRLGISTHTAKFHVGQIIAKLDAQSRAHAVAKALRAGLVDA